MTRRIHLQGVVKSAFVAIPLLALGVTVSELPLAGLSIGMLTMVVALSARISSAVVVSVVAASTCISGIRLDLGSVGVLPEQVVLVFAVVHCSVRAREVLFRVPTSAELAFFGWIGVGALTSALNAVDSAASLRIVAWLAASWLILYIINGLGIGRVPDATGLAVRSFCVVSATIGAVVFCLFILEHLPTLDGLIPRGPDGRLVSSKGLAFEANLFGAQMLIAYSLMSLRTDCWARSSRILLQVALLGGIVGSGSRGVWLGLMAFELVRRCLAPWDGRSLGEGAASPLVRQSVGLFLTFAVAMSLVLSSGTIARAVTLESGTGLYRYNQWNLAIEDIQRAEHPLLGMGVNSYSQRHANPFVRGEAGYLSNLPLVVVYDTGLIGTGLFWLAVVFTLRSRRTGRAAGIGAVVAFVVSSTATSAIWFGFVWIMFAAVSVEDQRGRSASLMPAHAGLRP